MSFTCSIRPLSFPVPVTRHYTKCFTPSSVFLDFHRSTNYQRQSGFLRIYLGSLMICDGILFYPTSCVFFIPEPY